MPSFETRVVGQLVAERRGLQRVLLDDGSRAYVLTQLIGTVAAGDRVVVNTTAVDLGLGTGGWHVVHWNLSRDGWSEPGPGHIMKLRYTSLQVDTGAAEEAVAEDPELPVADLRDRPVVCCGLHSQVACVAAVLKHLSPRCQLTYVMTEAAGLALALSDLVAALRERGLLEATITAGQAFGGEREAVNLPSALALADGDAMVVAPGPGVVGTGTALGASALELAPMVDMVAALGGTPIVALRYSEVDARPRHRGVSRQTLVALSLAARPAVLAVPEGPHADRIATELKAAGLDEHHRIELVEVPDVVELLDAAGLDVTTMGRTARDDPGFFAVTAAAGAVAARALGDSRPSGSVA